MPAAPGSPPASGPPVPQGGSPFGPYSSPGHYQTGVWLIFKDNQLLVVNRQNLPPEGTGWTYYWLGSTVTEALARFLDGFQALDPNGNLPDTDIRTEIEDAFKGKKTTVQQGTFTGQLQQNLNPANWTGIGPAISALVDTVKALFNADLWKGIGLILAGGLVLVFAALEVKKSI